jgi:hypothetical protein
MTASPVSVLIIDLSASYGQLAPRFASAPTTKTSPASKLCPTAIALMETHHIQIRLV